MHSVGEGEGGKIWENGMETCVISCMKKKDCSLLNTFLVGVFFVCVCMCTDEADTAKIF